MVKTSHETQHRIFQEHPPLVVTSLNEVFGIPFLQPKEVSVLGVDLTEIRPIERRADTAVLVETGSGRHLFVVEAQSAPEESRKVSWPYYVAYLHNKHSCPVTLLVTTTDLRTARWARQPINVGLEEAPSQITRPLVLGPDNVPKVTTVDQAHRDVNLAMLSVMTHRHSPDVEVIVVALQGALSQEDPSTAADLAEFIEVSLNHSLAGQIWSAKMGTMTHEYQSELRRRGRAEGLQEGLQEGDLRSAAAAVLRVLEARGISVPETVARRVNECTDQTVLENLQIRAATIERVDDLFADPIA